MEKKFLFKFKIQIMWSAQRRKFANKEFIIFIIKSPRDIICHIKIHKLEQLYFKLIPITQIYIMIIFNQLLTLYLKLNRYIFFFFLKHK